MKLLSPQSSYLLLTQRRTPSGNEEKEHANLICNSVGFLPLAIVIIGAYLGRYKNISFAEYHKELTKNRLYTIDYNAISGNDLVIRHETSVKLTLQSQWNALESEAQSGNQKIKRDCKNAKILFLLLGLFPESSLVSKARLVLFSAIKEQGSSKLDRPLDSAVIILKDLNLIDELENGKTLRIHPLLRSYALTKIKEPSALASKEMFVSNFMGVSNNIRCLLKEIKARGIFEFIEDVNTSLQWSSENSKNDLRQLKHLLEIGSHFFSQESFQPLFVSQQLFVKSAELGYDKLADKFNQHLSTFNQPYFTIKWAIVPKKSALKRTIKVKLYDYADRIHSLSVSRDSSYLIAASGNTISTLDFKTGREISNYSFGYQQKVTITPDSKYGISTSGIGFQNGILNQEIK
jgi:hypothetical protein